MNWLDTQTKEWLQSEPPTKLAPPKIAEYGLVLLRKTIDQRRLVRAICRINNCERSTAEAFVRQPIPLTISSDLEFGDAQLGHFELICCDAAAAILRSEVLEQGDKNYLESLFKQISASPEFKSCALTIIEIPLTDAGGKFADQFLGIGAPELQRLAFPFQVDVPLNKARIMKHWANRIGVRLEIDEA